MNKLGMAGVFLVVGLLSVPVFAQKGGEESWAEVDRQLDLRQRQLGIEAREMEIEFQRRMQELELEGRRFAMEREAREGEKDDGSGVVFLLAWVVVNILMTVWVYQDLQKRKAGSGLWIPVTLLAGLLGALVYAVARLGDQRQESA